MDIDKLEKLIGTAAEAAENANQEASETAEPMSIAWAINTLKTQCTLFVGRPYLLGSHK